LVSADSENVSEGPDRSVSLTGARLARRVRFAGDFRRLAGYL